MSNAQDTDSLLSSSSRRNKRSNDGTSNSSRGVSVTKHGIFSVVLLLFLGAVSIYMDYEITTLQTQLGVEKKHVAELESVVSEHSSVIQRFNCKF